MRVPLKSLHAFIALCLSLVLTLPASAAEWLRADTPNFVIYSDGYPHEVTRWAKRVEMLDALLRVRFDKPGPRKGTKLTIYMVENSNAVERLTGRKNLHGLYSPSSEGSFAITHRKLAYYDNQLSGQMTLFHEYAHHFMFRNFPSAYPAWYREGFAEFVSTVEFDIDGAATFGLPSGYRAKHLRKSPPPMEKLLLADVGNIKPKVRAPFYAWSWLLVHMLNSDPARAAQLRDYLARFAAGAGPEQAAGAFGDLHALERSLEAYSKQRPQALEKYPPIAAETEIKVTALGPSALSWLSWALNEGLEKI